MATYDTAFFSYTDQCAQQSAEIVLRVMKDFFPVASVADFGCGNGSWLAAWQKLGVCDCVGVDGEYVDRGMLLINDADFVAADLRQPVRLDRRFDLVQSLEVAEHLPKNSAEIFVDTLVSHGDIVLFSAAAPGQGGLQHVNEQPYSYWRALFYSRGYEMLDAIRPQIRHEAKVQPWYRFNTFVFVRKTVLASLPEQVIAARLPEGRPIPDISPPLYRLRKAVLWPLPVFVINRLSVLHARWVQWKNP